MKNLLDFTLNELKEQLSPPFRAKQIFEWIYKKNATGFDEMLNLPKDLRANLAQEFYSIQYQVIEEMIKIRNGFKNSIIVITHNMGVVSKMADNVAITVRK